MVQSMSPTDVAELIQLTTEAAKAYIRGDILTSSR